MITGKETTNSLSHWKHRRETLKWKRTSNESINKSENETKQNKRNK